MKNLFVILFITILAVAGTQARAASDRFVFVQGGTFKDTKSNFYGRNVTLSGFTIGTYEVTQREWVEVMGSNPSQFRGDDLPVETVSWYDCIVYCNRRSLKEGLQPYYTINRNKVDPDNESENDDVRWTVTINSRADGYRLPTEAEWEYAAGGGSLSKSYAYSGGNAVDAVAWTWTNAGDEKLTGLWYWPAIDKNHDRTHPVGRKQANELGLYDMSGNVREWCWDWYGDLKSNVPDPQGSSHGAGRVWKGGGWIGAEFCCAPSFRAGFDPNGKGPDQGFRVCRGRKPEPDRRGVADAAAKRNGSTPR